MIIEKIKNGFGKILNFFKDGKAKQEAKIALVYAVEALPYIKIAADIITGLTPFKADDVAWLLIKTKFPKLFDGSIHTVDELDAYALSVAGNLLKFKFPHLSMTSAILATQIAYTHMKAENGLLKISKYGRAVAVNGVILNATPPKKSFLSI